MGKYGSATYGSFNDPKLQDTLHTKASFNETKYKITRKHENQKYRRNIDPNRKIIKIKSSYPHEVHKRFPITNIFEEETEWRLQNNHQLKKSQQLREHSEISSPKLIQYTKSPVGKRLHAKNRYIPGILPHTRIAGTPTLPYLRTQPVTLSYDMSPLRPSQCPFSICEDYKLAGTVSKRETPEGDRIFRRFSINARRSGGPGPARKLRHRSFRKARMVCQPLKIYNYTDALRRILGSNLGHGEKPEISTTRKSRSISKTSIETSRSGPLELVGCKEHSRETKFCFRSSTLRTPTLQKYSEVVNTHTKDESPGYNNYRSSRQTRPHMVDSEPTQVFSDSSETRINFHNNRRSRRGMGSSSKQQEAKRQMECPTKSLALQPEGAMGPLRSAQERESPPKRKIDHLPIRQSNNHSLYQQTGGDKIHHTPENSFENTTSSCTNEHHHNCQIPARQIKWDCRQPVKRKCPTRMALKRCNSEPNLSEIRDATSRPVCIETVSSCKELCKRGCLRPEQSVYRRFQSNLELRTGVDLSTTSVDTESPSPSKHVHRNLLARSSGVGKCILDTDAGEQIKIRTPPVALPARSPNRPTNTETSAGDRQHGFAGMANTGWSDLINPWRSELRQIVENSWRKSSIKTYRPTWERWVAWASKEGVSVKEPGAIDMAHYLGYLHTTIHLAPNTIALHKSVVCTFTNPNVNTNIGSHPLVKHMLKGIVLEGRKRPCRPTWDVTKLTDWLTHYKINETSIFQVSRHVAILLLLTTGRRIHDLTLLDIRDDFFEITDTIMRVWPRFGSKTDSDTYLQSGWEIIPNPVRNLDLITWTRQLLEISAPRRNNIGITNLFITTRGRVAPASRTVIAGWIRTLFKEANIEAPPGSCRASVASSNWLRGYTNIEEIMKKGNWQTAKTFFNHYLKPIDPKPQTVVGNNLSDNFLPIE